jgi:hypothetical protein
MQMDFFVSVRVLCIEIFHDVINEDDTNDNFNSSKIKYSLMPIARLRSEIYNSSAFNVLSTKR